MEPFDDLLTRLPTFFPIASALVLTKNNESDKAAAAAASLRTGTPVSLTLTVGSISVGGGSHSRMFTDQGEYIRGPVDLLVFPDPTGVDDLVDVEVRSPKLIAVNDVDGRAGMAVVDRLISSGKYVIEDNLSRPDEWTVLQRLGTVSADRVVSEQRGRGTGPENPASLSDGSTRTLRKHARRPVVDSVRAVGGGVT